MIQVKIKVVFLEKNLAKNFALSDAEDNKLRPLNRRDRS